MDGIRKIERIVAYLDVWLGALFPIAKMKAKIVETPSGAFTAFANLALRNSTSGIPEFTSGSGSTQHEALTNLLTNFVSEAKSHPRGANLTEDDFEWSAPEDF